MSEVRPRRLGTRQLEKVWGSTALSPWYPDSAEKIGEVWFKTVDGIPLLIKFIFTSERLSIQVHPDDEAARAVGEPRGKTEMWYILRSDPGGAIGIGLRETVSRERLRKACVDGSIEELLDWRPVKEGDVIFVPAGTIHAIGAGLALCEIQQLSDTTYRLYDYGRPRELHLDRGVAVADAEPYRWDDGRSAVADGVRLVSCPYFVTDEVVVEEERSYVPDPSRAEILICMRGGGWIAGESFRLGEAWVVLAGSDVFPIVGPAVFLRTYVP